MIGELYERALGEQASADAVTSSLAFVADFPTRLSDDPVRLTAADALSTATLSASTRSGRALPPGRGVAQPLDEGELSSLQIEDSTGARRPLPVTEWLRLRPGDEGLLSRSSGPVLDVGSGPGRLTVALTERGVLALGIDIAPTAVAMTVAAGGPALVGDVFAQVPGAGLWQTILLADGNIGIGGDPSILLRRLAQLLAPEGRILAEVNAPGGTSRRERVRLRSGETVGPWFPWAQVAADDLPQSGLTVAERWEEADRCFVALTA